MHKTKMQFADASLARMGDVSSKDGTVLTSPAELKPPGETGAPILRSSSVENRRVFGVERMLRVVVGLQIGRAPE